MVNNMVVINLNEIVKVKLTSLGKELYYHRYDFINTAAGREVIKPKYPYVDTDGYTRFKLHEFMNLYGEYIRMGSPNVIEPLEIVYEGCEKIIKDTDKLPSLKDAISSIGGCKDVAGDYVLRDPEHMLSFIPPYTKSPLGYCRQYEIDEQWRKVADIFKHRVACMNTSLADCTKYTACIGCPHRDSLDGFKSAMKFVIEHVEGKEIK